MEETFFTTIGCMDGRVQEPVRLYGQKKFNAIYPDTITRAGLDGELPERRDDIQLLDSLYKKLEVSIEKHHAKGIVVHGHEACAGNPVSDEEHILDIAKTVQIVTHLIHGVIPVVGVYVKRSAVNPHEWIVEEVPQNLL